MTAEDETSRFYHPITRRVEKGVPSERDRKYCPGENIPKTTFYAKTRQDRRNMTPRKNGSKMTFQDKNSRKYCSRAKPVKNDEPQRTSRK